MSSSSYKYKHSSTVFLWLHVKDYYISCYLLLHCIFSLCGLLVCAPRPAIQAGSTVSTPVPVWTPEEVGWFSFTCPVSQCLASAPGRCLGFWHTAMPEEAWPTGRDFCCFLKAQQVAAGDQFLSRSSPRFCNSPAQEPHQRLPPSQPSHRPWEHRKTDQHLQRASTFQKFVPHGVEGFIQHRLGSQ